MNDESATPMSELDVAMKDVELLVAYIARTGKSVPREVLDSLIAAKHQFATDSWSSQIESEFWFNFNQAIKTISPVTMASLKEVACTNDYAINRNAKGTRSRPEKTIIRYATGAFISVFLIIVLQTYHLIGINVLEKSNDIFEQRNAVRTEIKQFNADKRNSILLATKDQKLESASIQARLEEELNESNTYVNLKTQENILDQQFDANRMLLYDWNTIWRLGSKIEYQLSAYDSYMYNKNIHDREQVANALKKAHSEGMLLEDNLPLEDGKIEEHDPEVEYSFTDLEAKRELDKARSVYFKNSLSAQFVIDLLQIYLLPLLYGCLGAYAFTLRTVSLALKEEVFTRKDGFNYNLRIILGAVSGIAIGLFFNGDNDSIEGSFSPMALAFLVGYNVEVLFSLLDNAARQVGTMRSIKT